MLKLQINCKKQSACGLSLLCPCHVLSLSLRSITEHSWVFRSREWNMETLGHSKSPPLSLFFPSSHLHPSISFSLGESSASLLCHH